MALILGILIGILLSIIAMISGKKINTALEKFEREKEQKEHPQKMAQVIKMQDKIKELLSND